MRIVAKSGLGTLAILAGFSAALRGDLVVLKKGVSVVGRVVSVDSKVVRVKTESGIATVERDAVTRIEFGEALITGLKGRDYASAEYRLRVAVPERWSIISAADSDLKAESGKTIFAMQGVALNASASEAEIRNGVMSGFGGAQNVSIEGPEDRMWAGVPTKKYTVKSADGQVIALFPKRSGWLLAIIFVAQGDDARELSDKVAIWEKQFRFFDQ